MAAKRWWPVARPPGAMPGICLPRRRGCPQSLAPSRADVRPLTPEVRLPTEGRPPEVARDSSPCARRSGLSLSPRSRYRATISRTSVEHDVVAVTSRDPVHHPLPGDSHLSLTLKGRAHYGI